MTGDSTGFLRAGERGAVAGGSQLNSATGTFTWAPGVGFVGTYDLAFVARRTASARDVRIVIYPKGRGLVGPQVVIDARVQHDVAQPFLIGGWAADLDAARGLAWRRCTSGRIRWRRGAGLPRRDRLGGARPDVATVHGEQFRASGFGWSCKA